MREECEMENDMMLGGMSGKRMGRKPIKNMMVRHS